MADDWQVGDLAVAVGVRRADFPNGRFNGQRADGKIRRVDGVIYRGGTTGLVFDGFPSTHPLKAWHSASFRKVVPDKREACEEEFRILLNLSKKRVSA